MIPRPTSSPAVSADRVAVIDLQPGDDLGALRRRLDRADHRRVALRLPWDLGFLSRHLDFDLLGREARRRRFQIAIVSPDPYRRQLARGCGFPTFASVEAAVSTDRWNGRGSPSPAVEPPPTYWWEEEPDLHASSSAGWLSRVASASLHRAWPEFIEGAWPRLAEWAKDGIRFLAFLVVILVLAGTAYAVIPTAEITIVPAGQTVTVDVPISVDPEVESVIDAADGRAIIPSRRIGMEVEGHADVATTETTNVASGRATGEVLFTSRLAQDYVVPAGTVVRTSSTSYPIRFRTTADVVVPAGGQAKAPIKALDERTGNVGAFQINRVEGVAASAVRVTNPAPTTGAEAKEVPVVVQADYDRVREQLTAQLLDQAYTDLHALLEPDEFLPYPSLRVEAVPKKAYTHFIGEQAETVGLNMRLLVSGQAVNRGDARAVARRALVARIPPGYRLVDARFDVGQAVEETEGPGWFTFRVTGRGYVAADISGQEVVAEVRGQRVPDARAHLQQSFPLAQPPRFDTWPTWPDWLAQLHRVPLIPLRIDVHVTPEGADGALSSSASGQSSSASPLRRRALD
jgi:hypothetical protein